VDLALRTLADAGLALDAAEEALAAGEATVAEERLAEVDDQLAAVRERWADLSPAARAVTGPAGKQVRERRDALAKRLPKRRALSEAAPTAPDPDEDRPPEEG
jgi:DNA-binding transcriptional MerR regulator